MKQISSKFIFALPALMGLVFGSCQAPNSSNDSKTGTHSEFKDYWYNGQAEISNFKLSQARYGELRDGSATLIFVTEPYSPALNTKPNNPSGTDIPVLKLNATKKFNTGIYPYSMMNSSFYPIDGEHSLKISSSSQEWCGHTYMELVNDRKFEIKIHSYFEGESGEIKLEKFQLEDDVWSKIRIAPDQLPTGNFKMIPSFFYVRLMHKELKAYGAIGKNQELNPTTRQYTIEYPALERALVIKYQAQFPYQILSWSETYKGFDGKELTTTADRIKTLKIDYWNKNSNGDSPLRDDLGL